jgi:membrane associated rhomboid family serine protease
MAIEVKCSCGKTLLAPDNSAGKRGRCPACGNPLIVRAPQSREEPRIQPVASKPSQSSSIPTSPVIAAPSDIRVPPVAAADDDEYRLAPEQPAEPPPVPAVHPDGGSAPGAPKRKPKICPSCERELPAGSKVCIACGIVLKTGKSLRTSHGVDHDAIFAHAESVAAALSWIIPIAVFPIASDAFGKFKPLAIRCLALAIVVVSLFFWAQGFAARARHSGLAFGPWQDLMLWSGSRPNPNLDGAPGEFHWYQLLTNTFLHGGLLHLAGNMVFLLVFGDRINALVGNAKSIVLYLLLGIAASVIFLISRIGDPVVPALGASGAIMGMAGMYFVLMPTSRVHMIAWMRLGLITGFHRETNFFDVPGYGVLLFYFGWDVLSTLIHWSDGTAHWAHMGGFVCGMVAAVALLLTRQVDAQGGDMISVVLGRHAWKILGKPADRAERQ